MSEVLKIFSEKRISGSELFDFVRSLGGYIIDAIDPTHIQGVLELGKATIWVIYPEDIKDRDTEFFKENYNLDVNTKIILEMGNADGTAKLALGFCKSFMNHYPSSVILEDNGRIKYYTSNEIQRTECSEDDIWVVR